MTMGRPAAGRNTRYEERLPGATPSFIRQQEEGSPRDEDNGAFDFSSCSRDTATSAKTLECARFHGGHVASIK